MNAFRIRPAVPADIPALMALERDAAQLYLSIGYDFCADGEVRDEDEHRRGIETDGSFVAEAPDATLAGFMLLWRLDGRAHVTELSVASAHQEQGLGRQLLARGENWAQAEGYAEITLTTFRDVPWNRPFYERCGYTVFEPGEDRPQLAAVIAMETAFGVAARPRVAMRKPL